MNKIEEYIEKKGHFTFALNKWGLQGNLDIFRKEIDRFMYSNKYDLDDYCGLFLMGRLAIEDFYDEGLFTDSQREVIKDLDSIILANTVNVQCNVYTLTAIKKTNYDKKKYWFLYRIPFEAIERLKLNDVLVVLP